MTWIIAALGILKKLLGWVPLFVAYLAGQRAAEAKASRAAVEAERRAAQAAVDAPRSRDELVDRLRKGGGL